MTSILPIVMDNIAFRPNGRPVLNGLSATLPDSGITALVGPNGAGKSVTLRVIDGLIQADAGSVRFGSRTTSAVRRAFVFQRPALIRGSVARNVNLALAPLYLERSEGRARVKAALLKVGLQHRADDPAGKLSGGERQRLALARAWVTEPELLLLDEPTANLDPAATEAIEALVSAMARAGTKVIIVSHNLGQVARLAEDILVLWEGQAVEHGLAQHVLARPKTPQAQAYINGELPWTSFAAASWGLRSRA
jgi:tungstate transport system ATP-binding protein